jgi:hypothetical protein
MTLLITSPAPRSPHVCANRRANRFVATTRAQRAPSRAFLNPAEMPAGWNLFLQERFVDCRRLSNMQ